MLGGLTTFLTLAYIVVVNPAILSAAGIPLEGAVLATCVSAALGCALMALLANYPVALAPGMGLNAFFAFSVCLGAGIPWRTGLGLVFWAGVIFLVLTLTGARRALVKAVPETLKLAAAAGIGLFIAFIGLRQGGLVRADPNTLVALGDLGQPPVLLALGGLALTLGLLAAGVRTAVFWGLLASLGAALGLGLLEAPASWVSLPSASFPGLEIDLLGALRLEYLPLILAIVFFDVFDTLGTLMGIAHEGGLVKDGEIPRLDRAMTADSLASLAGSLFGTSTVTSYIESGAGVAVGARTGLAALTTGALLLAAVVFTPLATAVGRGMEGGLNPITAPALVAVGSLMLRAVRKIRWDDPTESLPAFFTLLLMPLTFSISHGLAAGIVVYVLTKTAAGRGREVHPLLYGLALVLVVGYGRLPF
jgi:AGZA family xanthine/uracil permease-like MFS transporter